MKWLVLPLVFFFLLQLQCAQGASLAEKLQDDEQEIEDTGVEEELEDGSITNRKYNNETHDAHQNIDTPKQNTMEDSKQEKHQEYSSSRESSESVEPLENRTLSHELTFSSEEVGGESSNITVSTLNNTMKKNETMRRNLQTRLGIGTAIGGTSQLNFGVGGSTSDTGPSSLTTQGAGVNQQVGAGMDANSQQTAAIRPSIATSSQTDISTVDQNNLYTSNNLNANLWPTTLDNFNTNAGGSIQSSQQQTRPSTTMGPSSLSTINNWPTYQGNFDTNFFTDSTTLNNQEKNAASTVTDSNTFSTANDWPTTQGSLNTNALTNGVVQNNQQQSRPTVATGSQNGIAATSQNRPSTIIGLSASSTIDNWPKPQNNLNTNPFSSSIQNNQQQTRPFTSAGNQAAITTDSNPFADGRIQINQQQSRPSLTAGSQVGVTTIDQNRPSTESSVYATSATNNWQTVNGGINSNAFGGGAIQNNQHQSKPSLTAGSQLEVTTIDQNRPSTEGNTYATSTANNWQNVNGGINTNAFGGGAIQNNQQQSRPSLTAGSQLGDTTIDQNRPSTEGNTYATSTANNWQNVNGGINTNAFGGGAIQNNQQQSRPSLTAGSQLGVTTIDQNRPSTEGITYATSTANNWQNVNGGINTNAFGGGAIQNNQQQNRPSLTAGSQLGVTTIDQNRPTTDSNPYAISTANTWQSVDGGINTNAFGGGAIQNNQQQIGPSLAIASQATVTTNQYRPSTAVNGNAVLSANNLHSTSGSLNSNAFAGGTIQSNHQQTMPSLTAGSQVGVTTIDQNRPSTESNTYATSTANNWQSVDGGINTNAFGGGAIQNNQQHIRPSLAIASQATVTTNQYRPSTAVNGNAVLSANNLHSTSGSLNSNAFAGGTIQSNHQQTMPSLTAGSQVGVTTIDQNRPPTESNTYATSTANNWPTLNGGINTNVYGGGAIQNNQQQIRPSLPTVSQAGVTLNQYTPYTANGLSTNLPVQQGYNGETSSSSTTNNSGASHQSETDALDPLTKISQLMKVMEVISNATSAHVPETLGREKGYVNISQDSHLKQNVVDVGQGATKLNQQYNNVRPTNNSKRSLDDLTKVVQLLKVIEVISNATSDEEVELSPGQYTGVGSTTPALVPYDVDVTTNSNTYLENELSLNTQGNSHSSIGFTYRPTSDIGGTLVSYAPNYQNNYIPNQTITTNYDLNQSNELSQNNQLTPTAAVNVIGENTNNHYKQNFPMGQTTASAVANINVNNLASSDQVLSQGISASTEQNHLAAAGNGQASASTSPSSSGIKRRSLANLVKTVELLDTIETLANMNNQEQIDGINSEPLTSNTNQQAALQNGATVINNLNLNTMTQINTGLHSPQEVAQNNNIQHRPLSTTKVEPTQLVGTDVKLSNMAEMKPATTLYSQQNIRPTLSLQNSKDTGSLSAIPNYLQQTSMSATGLTQVEIANQHRPSPAINDNSKTTLNNNSTVQGDYMINQYNEQHARPSIMAGSQIGLVNQNQNRPNAEMDTNAALMLNGITTVQGGLNANDVKGSNQYTGQQTRPSVAGVSLTGVSSNQYKPHVASDTSTSTTIHKKPTTQEDININDQVNFVQNNKETNRPSLSVGSQTAFVNNNQYRPFEPSNLNPPTTTNNIVAKQEGQRLEQSSDAGNDAVTNPYRPNPALNVDASIIVHNAPSVQGGFDANYVQQTRPSVAAGGQSTLFSSLDRPISAANTNAPNMIGEGRQTELVGNGVLNKSTENDTWKMQNGINTNALMEFNQYNKQQITPSVSAGSHIGLNNNSLHRPNLSLATDASTIVQNSYNEYGSNTALNTNATKLINNSPTLPNGININNISGIYLNSTNQQIRPSMVAGHNTGADNNNQYRPSGGSNENVQTIISYNPTAQGVYNINSLANQLGEQPLGAIVNTGSQAGINSNNQYRPNASINGSVQNIINHFPTVQGNMNFNEQQIRPSVATASTTGLVNMQDRANVTWNAGAPILTNGIPTVQGGGINKTDGVNQFNELLVRPSLATGNQNGLINTNHYSPNTAFNVMGRDQDTFNMNDYNGVTQNNQQQFRPSIGNGMQTGIVKNQYPPNAAFNNNILTTLNNLPTDQDGINMNSYTGVNQYDQHIAPSLATGTQNQFINNQYTPNSSPLSTATNLSVLQGVTNQQQSIPSVTAGAQTGLINNQYTPNPAFNFTTTNSLPNTQGGTTINSFDGTNKYNQQHMRPSVATTTQTGFDSNNQYRPNAALNTSATTTNYTPTTLYGYNQYNEHQIRPSVASGSQSGILTNNQIFPSSGLHATENSLGPVQDRLKVNQSVAVNQNNSSSISSENGEGLVSKVQTRPTAIINANINTQGAIAIEGKNKQQSQSSVKAESKVNLNSTSNNKPQFTQINTIPKDLSNFNQTLTQETTKINDKKQKADTNKQYGSLQAKNSSTSTTEKQLKTIENTAINLNPQHIKQSNAGKTQVGSVSSKQQVPSPSVNSSSSTSNNNLLIPLVNPSVTNYATTNHILPQVQAPAVLNNPTAISEYNLNTSSYNSKLIEETSRNHTSEIIRNQLIHSTPIIQGLTMPSIAGLLSNYSQHVIPLAQEGASKVNLYSGNPIISSEKQNNTSSLNNNQKIASSILPTELHAGVVTHTKANNTTDTKEINRHVDCVKKEPLSNGSIAITTVGDCTMHQNLGDAIQLDNKQASGTSSSSSLKNDIPVNIPTGSNSLFANGISNNKNEINNIATASSEVSFNGTVDSINKGKSETSAAASSKLEKQSSAGLHLAAGI